MTWDLNPNQIAFGLVWSLKKRNTNLHTTTYIIIREFVYIKIPFFQFPHESQGKLSEHLMHNAQTPWSRVVLLSGRKNHHHRVRFVKFTTKVIFKYRGLFKVAEVILKYRRYFNRSCCMWWACPSQNYPGQRTFKSSHNMLCLSWYTTRLLLT